MRKKKEPTLTEAIDAAYAASRAKTLEEFRKMIGLSNGTFYALRASGRIVSLPTLNALKKAGVQIPASSVAA